MLGGNEIGENQGVLGLEGDESDSSDSLNMRVNIRSYAGFNTRDRYGKNPGGMTDMDVGPLRFSCPDIQFPTWRVPIQVDQCNAPSGMKMWGGTLMFDKTLRPGNAVTNWYGEFTPMLACELDCCTTLNCPDEPAEPNCEFVTARSRFKTNAQDVNGNYEWVIPYGWTATTGRLSVLHAICCHNRHIGEIWNFLNRLTYWIGQYAACTDAFFGTKVDGQGQESICCSLAGTVEVPAVDCGPTTQNEDCDGNPITC